MNKEQISKWTKEYIAELVNVNIREIDVNVPFERYGLDSTAAVALSGELSELIGFDLEANIIFNYPTIGALSEEIASLIVKEGKQLNVK